jgi:hypothetical protein
VDSSSQTKNTLLDLIKKEMDKRGWDEPRLVKESKVSQPVVFRLLRGSVNAKIENLYKILNALGLLSGCEQPQCPINCSSEMQEWCSKVKYVIESKTLFSGALTANILAFHEGVGLERRVKNLEKTRSKEAAVNQFLSLVSFDEKGAFNPEIGSAGTHLYFYMAPMPPFIDVSSEKLVEVVAPEPTITFGEG